MTQDSQRYFVELQFNYSGRVFDGDPTDLDQLATLEEFGLAEALENHLNEFYPSDVDNVQVKVSAVRNAK